MVKGAFTNLAEDIDPALSNSWHKDMPKNDVAEMFIEKILERFPLVFLDDSLKNPSQRAVHCRRAWNDEGLGFETRKQAILINGPVSRR